MCSCMLVIANIIADSHSHSLITIIIIFLARISKNFSARYEQIFKLHLQVPPLRMCGVCASVIPVAAIKLIDCQDLPRPFG